MAGLAPAVAVRAGSATRIQAGLKNMMIARSPAARAPTAIRTIRRSHRRDSRILSVSKQAVVRPMGVSGIRDQSRRILAPGIDPQALNADVLRRFTIRCWLGFDGCWTE